MRGTKPRHIADGLFKPSRAQEFIGRVVADRLVRGAEEASEQGCDPFRLMAQQGAAGPERGFCGVNRGGTAGAPVVV